MIQMTVLCCLVLLFCAIYYRRAIWIFSPEMHVLGYFCIFFALPFAINNVYVPQEVQDYGDINPFLSLFPAIIAPIVFGVMIYSIIFRWAARGVSANYFENRSSLIISELRLSWVLLVLALLYFIILSQVLLVKYDFSYVLNNFDRFAMEIRNGSAAILNILYTIELLPLLYCCFSRKPSYLKLAFLLSAVAVVALLLGARTIVVTSFVSILLVLLARSRINFGSLGILLSLLVSLFLLSSIIRMGGADDDLAEKLGGYLSRNSDQFANTAVVVKLLEDETLEPQYGATMQDALYYFIPRALYPDKPVSYFPSRLIYGEVAERTGRTFNFGLLGRALLDFSYAGTIILLVSFYILMVLVYKYIRSFKLNLTYVFFVWLYSHLIQIFILGVNSHFISIAVFNFSVLIFFFSFIKFVSVRRQPAGSW